MLFGGEVMAFKKIWLIVAGVCVLLLFVWKFYVHDWLQIDKCLDSGGKWDYRERICAQ